MNKNVTERGEVITLLTIGAFLVITAASMISSVFLSKNKEITKSNASIICDPGDYSCSHPQPTETPITPPTEPPAVTEPPQQSPPPQPKSCGSHQNYDQWCEGPQLWWCNEGNPELKYECQGSTDSKCAGNSSWPCEVPGQNNPTPNPSLTQSPSFCNGHSKDERWCEGNKWMGCFADGTPYVWQECKGPDDPVCAPGNGWPCARPGDGNTTSPSSGETPTPTISQGCGGHGEKDSWCDNNTVLVCVRGIPSARESCDTKNGICNEETPNWATCVYNVPPTGTNILTPVPTPQIQTIPETRTIVAGHDQTLEDIIKKANIPHVTDFWCYPDGTCTIVGDGIKSEDIQKSIQDIIVKCYYYSSCQIQAPTGIPK